MGGGKDGLRLCLCHGILTPTWSLNVALSVRQVRFRPLMFAPLVGQTIPRYAFVVELISFKMQALSKRVGKEVG